MTQCIDQEDFIIYIYFHYLFIHLEVYVFIFWLCKEAVMASLKHFNPISLKGLRKTM